MTIPERIEELRLQIQALQVEERIAGWMKKNWDCEIRTWDSGIGERPWRCAVGGTGEAPSAIGKGATEADARAHAFTIIFAREAT